MAGGASGESLLALTDQRTRIFDTWFADTAHVSLSLLAIEKPLLSIVSSVTVRRLSEIMLNRGGRVRSFDNRSGKH